MRGHISIFDLFGEQRELSIQELIAAGDKADLTEMNVKLLIQHAEYVGFLYPTEIGYSIDDPNYLTGDDDKLLYRK